MNKWEKLKNYINNREVGSIITRQDIITFNKYKRTSSYGSTIDNYKRCLMIIGILERTETLGMYKIKHHIKKDLTSSELKSIAYGPSFRGWFNDAKV